MSFVGMSVIRQSCSSLFMDVFFLLLNLKYFKILKLNIFKCKDTV